MYFFPQKRHVKGKKTRNLINLFYWLFLFIITNHKYYKKELRLK